MNRVQVPRPCQVDAFDILFKAHLRFKAHLLAAWLDMKALSRLYQGSIKALLRLHQRTIKALQKALLRLYAGSIKHLLRLY